MRIDHNIPALQAWMSVRNTQSEMQTSIQRLSTGYRINSAADDAAGYAIVEKMMGQISGLNTAIQNSQNAISAIQTASGALDQTQSILQRMRELAVEAANDTNTTSDRQQIQKEVNQLIGQIDQIRNTTQFNTQTLLNGNLNKVDENGTATLVNPSNTITGAQLDAGKISGNTTLTINTIETGTASAANAVQVYYQGNLLNTGTTSGSAVVESGAVNISGVSMTTSSGVVTTNGQLKIEVKTGSSSTDDKIYVSFNGSNISTVSMTSISSGTGTLNITAGGANFNVTITGLGSSVGTASFSTSSTELSSPVAQGTVDLSNNYVSLDGNTLSVNLSGGSANGGSTVKVDLTGMASSPSVYTTESKSSYQLVDSGAIRLDKGTSQNNDMVFQVGANQSQTIQLGINDMGAQALGLETTVEPAKNADSLKIGDSGYYSTIDVTTKEGAQSAITLVDNAIQVVSTESAKLGAIQNRLTHITHNLQTASTNLTSAQSTIKDVDMAKEMMTFSKQQILLQSSMAMLAQANSNPQQVLRLFR
ncbi:flagellin [Mesoaciditoga lauensis]|uniref:flagellin N-terminal helical domain-containing protein n=1 Tax=Mesoaciditoga lauensis TaxID=1495039 RepID=UPI000560A7E5|nr:flagellin [Mesoaciditoga lauensis]